VLPATRDLRLRRATSGPADPGGQSAAAAPTRYPTRRLSRWRPSTQVDPVSPARGSGSRWWARSAARARRRPHLFGICSFGLRDVNRSGPVFPRVCRRRGWGVWPWPPEP